MNAACPYCDSQLTIRDIKPGHFEPKCKKCGRRFRLDISGDIDNKPVIVCRPRRPSKVRASGIADKATEDRTTDNANDTAKHQAVTQETDRATQAQRSPERESASETPLAEGDEILQLRGYEIVGELGRGAMGVVYHAIQRSLNRDVALKTIQTQWLSDPVASARFTREAFAAARLTHHNIVQVYDFGEEDDTKFFSMELINGGSLADLVQGRVDPRRVVALILQAARGLQFAHNLGMVHRDVKPGNLLINQDGIVKVADLGLVKAPELLEAEKEDELDGVSTEASHQPDGDISPELTRAGYALGTAAYMAPEQADHAEQVDHRADIYSLGCSMYALLTGRPPFQGETALEVISRHRTDPVIRPDKIENRIPSNLADIVMRMVSKRPEERFANLSEMIDELEHLAGVHNEDAGSPMEEFTDTLEDCVRDFNQAPAVKQRSKVATGFLATMLLVCLATLVTMGWLLLEFVLNGTAASNIMPPLLLSAWLTVLTPPFYFVISGWLDRTYLFEKVRAFIFARSPIVWIGWLIGGITLLAILVVGLLVTQPILVPLVLGVALVSGGLAFAFYRLFDLKVSDQRQAAINEASEILKKMRSRGIDEMALRRFVADRSGSNWEEFFECLFGYEAKRAMRRELQRGDLGRKRNRFRGWRDYIVDAMDHRLKHLQDQRDKARLRQIEAARLEAQGYDSATARKQGEQVAEAVFDNAAMLVEASEELSKDDPSFAAKKNRARLKVMLSQARLGEYKQQPTLLTRIYQVLDWTLGSRVRFLMGCLLLAIFLIDLKQNDLLLSFVDEEFAIPAIDSLDLPSFLKFVSDDKFQHAAVVAKSVIPGVCGLLLIISSMISGWKLSLVAVPATALCLLSFETTVGIPGLTDETSRLVELGLVPAVILFAVGFLFCKE